MKKALGILLAVVLAVALAVPVVMAGEPPPKVVDTEVTVPLGGGSSPIIKCKWEQDTTPCLEDADPLHEKFDPQWGGMCPCNAQFQPPCLHEGEKPVQYWAIVTHEFGVEEIDKVYVDVYHPMDFSDARLAEMGLERKKYELQLTEQPKLVNPDAPDGYDLGGAIDAFVKAWEAKLVIYNAALYPDAATAYDDIMEELLKCVANVYMAPGVLDYHQPCGDYKVEIKAVDKKSNWIQFENCMTYECVCCFDIDFNKVDFGKINICSKKWIPGDTTFNDPVDTAPDPNPATVRSIGNCDLHLIIHQSDLVGDVLGPLGITGTDPETTYQGTVQPNLDPLMGPVESNWNVHWDARLGNNPANEKFFDPCVDVELLNKLKLCNKDELDLSIHVSKAKPDTYKGTMTLGCICVDWGAA